MIKYFNLPIVFAGFFMAVVSCSDGHAKDEVRPNFLVIYVDDMDLNDIAAYGGRVLTPNLDALAASGARFERYYATSPVCSPSRYSLFTGRYASRNKYLEGVTAADDVNFIQWNVHLEGDESTLAHILSGAGYVTALVGKHHNSANQKHQIRVAKDADPKDPIVSRTLQRNHEFLTRMIADHMGFDEVINVYANNFHVLDIPKIMHQHNPEWIVSGALDFLRRHQANPFFMTVALTIPHGPDNIKSMLSDPRITPRGYLDSAPLVQEPRQSVFKRVKDAGLPRHLANLTWLDDSVGAIVQELEDLGIREETMLVFASDHSDFGKMTAYEAGIRTACIVSWPKKIPEGRVIDALSSNLDWAPTFLAAAGIEVPNSYIIDGEDLLPLLTGEVTSVRDNLFIEITYTRGVVSKDWKYIATRFPKSLQSVITADNRHEFNQEGERMTQDPYAGAVHARYGVNKKYPGYYDDDQLYYLPNDSMEQKNLALDTSALAVQLELQAALRAHQADKPHAFGEFGGGVR
ncbi:MAG: sulfatase-like hydrolase/transferase [Verrucomicrobiota bacterium]|nr:sulfatase-like hydrolase/transferase [Verrucomicrobiota bacterium]